jgi:hypothetical protein
MNLQARKNEILLHGNFKSHSRRHRDIILIAMAVGFFVILPSLSRKADRSGGSLLAQVRVVALFGEAFFRFGGAFYRFSAYENYLVTSFVTVHSYTFEQVKIIGKFKQGSSNLTLQLNGVPVLLVGNNKSLERFYDALSQRLKYSIYQNN